MIGTGLQKFRADPERLRDSEMLETVEPKPTSKKHKKQIEWGDWAAAKAAVQKRL